MRTWQEFEGGYSKRNVGEGKIRLKGEKGVEVHSLTDIVL